VLVSERLRELTNNCSDSLCIVTSLYQIKTKQQKFADVSTFLKEFHIRIRHFFAKMEAEKLKVDHDLMNPDFEGYKLSLESVPCFATSLEKDLKVRSCGEEQVSILKVLSFRH
jgi:hypothetical protein